MVTKNAQNEPTMTMGWWRRNISMKLGFVVNLEGETTWTMGNQAVGFKMKLLFPAREVREKMRWLILTRHT